MDTDLKPIASLFKLAYDANFPEPYQFKKKDFCQFAQWRRTHPDVTPEQFVAVAQADWKNGQFKSGASLSIAGLCASWSYLIAKNMKRMQPKTRKEYKF
jgi:hypothetical protein